MADGKNKSIIMYGVIILVILIVDIVGGYFIGKKVLNYVYNTEGLQENVNGEDTEDKQVKDDTGVPGTMITLEPINLNPANSNGEIFSCDIVLEAKDAVVITELGTRNAQIMDKISTYLSLKTVQELNDAKLWDGYRKEMTDLINSLLSGGEISNIYIKQKIIQFE
ncbi:MAG: flagellar basal body-associated FliL family protein [Candidatus Latescibacteria bacterium]|nr:flagellar basal body-associated FliL family protein [Candidatus Latescibacterota bacterium]